MTEKMEKILRERWLGEIRKMITLRRLPPGKDYFLYFNRKWRAHKANTMLCTNCYESMSPELKAICDEYKKELERLGKPKT